MCIRDRHPSQEIFAKCITCCQDICFVCIGYANHQGHSFQILTTITKESMIAQSKAENVNKAMDIVVGSYQKQNNACLLYTSPSPRDQRGTRMPSSA
eukprot:TRINITY_DN3772_c0_g1_i1.p2 TRINITY_DN3772_c0_g1~~TRINITY_DN3772_c0_g1_i1.p2  ORF type:complete len:111 (+),score=49.17 TRINITY_DN3772_c0_g1_i1:45-335(+)